MRLIRFEIHLPGRVGSLLAVRVVEIDATGNKSRNQDSGMAMPSAVTAGSENKMLHVGVCRTLRLHLRLPRVHCAVQVLGDLHVLTDIGGGSSLRQDLIKHEANGWRCEHGRHTNCHKGRNAGLFPDRPQQLETGENGQTLFRLQFLIALAVVSLQPAAAWAQQKQNADAALYSLSGTVLDPSEAVIPGVQLVLAKQDGTTIGQAVADESGAFRFDNVIPGKYRVLVRALGFREVRIDLTIGPQLRPIRIAMSLDTHTESVTVGDSAPQVNTEISSNQSAATLDRSALDRVPVYAVLLSWLSSRQNKICLLSRDHIGSSSRYMESLVSGVADTVPAASASQIRRFISTCFSSSGLPSGSDAGSGAAEKAMRLPAGDQDGEIEASLESVR